MEMRLSCDCNTCGGDALCHYRSVEFKLIVKYNGEQTLGITSVDLVRENPVSAEGRAVNTKVSDLSEQKLSRSASTTSKGSDPLPLTRCWKKILRSKVRFIIRWGQIQMIHGLDPVQGALDKKFFGLRTQFEGGKSLEIGLIFTGSTSLMSVRRIPPQSLSACKDKGLHEADLPLHTNAWPQPCRSRPDLSDMSKFKGSHEPRRQIGGYSHRFNRGFADHDVQIEDRPNRSPNLEDCSPDRAKYCRSGVDLSDLPRSRQKIGGNPPDPEIKSVKLDLDKVDSGDLKQIFIRSTEGRHVCVQIWKWMSVLELEKEIQDKLGIPVALQNLLFSGLCLQDQHTLQHYRVAKDSTIILNLRLRGGSKGASLKPTGTYRDAAKGKEPLKGKESTAANEPPGQYIVDESPESPSISLDLPEWKQSLDYENTTFRCRGCQQTGHLYNACKSLNKSKPQQRKSKGWQNIDDVIKKRDAERKATPISEDEESEAEEDDTIIEEAETGNQKETTSDNKAPQLHPNQAEKIYDDQNMGGIKRHHQSDTSDSDKESGSLKAETQLVIASTEPTQGEWRKVEKKKRMKNLKREPYSHM